MRVEYFFAAILISAFEVYKSNAKQPRVCPGSKMENSSQVYTPHKARSYALRIAVSIDSQEAYASELAAILRCGVPGSKEET
jgi:hypothetical protein